MRREEKRGHRTLHNQLYTRAASGDEDAASGDSEASASLEEKLQQEIQRRGLSSTDEADGGLTERATEGSERARGSGVPPPPRWASQNQAEATRPPEQGQLRRSRELNAEGARGFLPRAFELIKLGFVSTAYFLPLALVIGLASFLLYAVAGSDLVHFGESQPSSPPAYDAEELLNEEPYDQTVPVVPVRPS